MPTFLRWESATKDTVITIRVPRELRRLVNDAAREQNIDVSKYIREQLYQLIQPKPNDSNDRNIA